jgi:DNA-binding transcriptional LysR family regulator
MHLVPALKGFQARYPELNVDLRLSDSIIDMVEGGFDIAVRIAALKDSTLIARKLSSDDRIVCASPEYLAEYGEPKSPGDLVNHPCITLMGLEHWTFDTAHGQKVIKATGSFRTDNGEAVRDACTDGLGITVSSILSVYKELNDGKLVQVLKDYPLVCDTAVWAVYPSSRLLAPKVRAFIDYYAECFKSPVYWDRKN